MKRANLRAAGIAGGYALFGALWIAFSDAAIAQLVADANEITRFQTWKGVFFIVVTAILVYLLSRSVLVREARLVAELRASESEVRALNAELEMRVRERTAQLEAANHALEAFSYSVSHDLKAPLRGIDGYSKLLLEDHGAQLDAEGREFLGKVREGAAQMHRLIDDLLAYSRMERRAVAITPVALAALVRAIVAERSDELGRRSIDVTVDVPEISVRADVDGLAIVLRNLFDNALKFTATTARPRIEVSARPEAGKVVLRVSDNGIGFDMKFHERIFEMFSRLEHAERYPGTGLGLALVRKAMQRMGGTARAEGQPGRGASFVVEIPA